MSPPIRNQVIQVPNWRPPRPHSSRCARVFGRRQCAAAKPKTVTRPKKKTKTASAVQSMSAVIAGLPVDDIGQQGCDGHPRQLIPVEKREAEQFGRGTVIERHPSHGGERDEKKEPNRAHHAKYPVRTYLVDDYLIALPPLQGLAPRQTVDQQKIVERTIWHGHPRGECVGAIAGLGGADRDA